MWVIKSLQRWKLEWLCNLWHAFTHHYITKVMCCWPLNARFSQRLLINSPYCQTIQYVFILERGILGAFYLQNQVPVEWVNNFMWAREMTQNDKLIPSSTSSHSCEIWFRSQIRLYSSPSPTGMLWLKLKESRNFSSWELGLTWAEMSNPSLKTWQPVPNHNRNQVEGTSVSPESVWHCREELQIRIGKYCCGWEGGPGISESSTC